MLELGTRRLFEAALFNSPRRDLGNELSELWVAPHDELIDHSLCFLPRAWLAAGVRRCNDPGEIRLPGVDTPTLMIPFYK
jgi:hypothetical protein